MIFIKDKFFWFQKTGRMQDIVKKNVEEIGKMERKNVMFHSQRGDNRSSTAGRGSSGGEQVGLEEGGRGQS